MWSIWAEVLVWLLSVGRSATVQMYGRCEGLHVGILNIAPLMEKGIAIASLICWYLVLAHLARHTKGHEVSLGLTLKTILSISKWW